MCEKHAGTTGAGSALRRGGFHPDGDHGCAGHSQFSAPGRATDDVRGYGEQLAVEVERSRNDSGAGQAGASRGPAPTYRTRELKKCWPRARCWESTLPALVAAEICG